jgi:predicted NAD/FAD-dependent oxidoreductase
MSKNQLKGTSVAVIWNPHLKVFKNNQWQDSTSNENRYVGIPAMNSPSKYLAKNLPLALNQTIDQITYYQDKWYLHSLEQGDIEQRYDWLVLALPAPQSMALAKSIERLATQANMQSCWTVMASFTENLNLPPGFSLQEDLKIGFCGDWLNGGRVEGAWLSGYKLASQIESVKN